MGKCIGTTKWVNFVWLDFSVVIENSLTWFEKNGLSFSNFVVSALHNFFIASLVFGLVKK